MLTLYGAPAHVSIVAHIALEESGLEYRTQTLSTKTGQQRSPEYLRLNPLGRIPALVFEDGRVLTEVAAILGYVASSVPERLLLPTEPWLRARADEWLSFLGTSIHTALTTIVRPERFTDDENACAALRRDGVARLFDLFRIAERRLSDAGYSIGESYTLCDAYAGAFLLWARRLSLPIQELPRYVALSERVLARPAVQRVFQQQGLGVT